MPDKNSSARFNERANSAESITVYDSRENLLIGDSMKGVSDIVARLFGSEVPVAYDGTYVYLAIRLSEGLNRSQTCYAVVSADYLNYTSDLKWVISEAVETTNFQLEQSTEEQLGYVCRLISNYDSVEVSREVDEMFRLNKSICCGVPDYAEALALLDRAIATGTSLAVSRRRAYFGSDSDEQIDLVDSVVVVDDQFDNLTYADDTQRAVDQIRNKRQRRSIIAAVEPIEGVVSDLRELGLDNEEIRKVIVTELSEDGTNQKRGGLLNSLFQNSNIVRVNKFDSKQFSSMVNNTSSVLTRQMMKAIVAFSGIIFILASAKIALSQLGFLLPISISSIPSVSASLLPAVSSVSVSFDASVVLLGAATMALLGFVLAVLSQ